MEDTAPRWVFIQRAGYNLDGVPGFNGKKDCYLGPFTGPSADDGAIVCANESLHVEDLLSPSGGGGFDCYVTTSQPDEARDDIYILDMADPNHTGIEARGVCRHCQHGIVRLTNGAWIAPDAGYDDIDGDGIWRETCPDNHDDRIAPHEPEEN